MSNQYPNQPMDDYERQFQADLEKAAALSLETLALDEFKRKQRHGGSSTGSAATQRNSINNVEQIRHIAAQRFQQQQQQERRKSEVITRDISAPDLISFAGPEPVNNEDPLLVANEPPAPVDSHTSFVQYVDQIHQLTAQQQQQQQYLGVRAPFGASTAITPFIRSPIPVAGPAGLALMPYQGPTYQHLQPRPPQTQPLTPDNLQKLYNNPYYSSASTSTAFNHNYQHRPQQHLRSSSVPATGQPPVPHHPPAILPFGAQTGYNNGGTGVASNFGVTPSVSTLNPHSFAAAGPSSQSYQAPPMGFIGGVANPESALVHVPKGQPNNHMPLMNAASPAGPPSNAHSSVSAGAGFSGQKLRRKSERQPDDNLIDLGELERSLDKVSVLEAFDPLMNSDMYSDKGDDDCGSECTYYSENDPFDYLYSGGTQYSDPVYEAVIKEDISPMSPGAGAPPIGWNIPTVFPGAPPPLPPRNSSPGASPTAPFTVDRRHVPTKLYQNVILRKAYDPELMAFYQMVLNVRNQFEYTDERTNRGHVVAQEFDAPYSPTTSIKILVHPSLEVFDMETAAKHQYQYQEYAVSADNNSGSVIPQIAGYGPPVAFTCDIYTTVEFVISHTLCALEQQISGERNACSFAIKPIGIMEWLAPESRLSHLECIHNCVKFDKDVQLALYPRSTKLMNGIGRTRQDDIRDSELKPEDIIAHERCNTINYDTLMILLETLETEIDRLESAASDPNPRAIVIESGVIGAVKAICALMGNIDTLDIAESIRELSHLCSSGQATYSYKEGSAYGGHKMDIISETGDYAEVTLRPRTIAEQVRYRCGQVRAAVQHLVEIYSNAFRVDFCVMLPDYATSPISIAQVKESVMVHVMCVHRPPITWKHDYYILGLQIYHGTRYICNAIFAQCPNDTSEGIYPRLTFNSWLNFENIPVAALPRESRLIFVLYGCTTVPNDGNSANPSNNDGANGGQIGSTNNGSSTNESSTNNRQVVKVELGWAAIQFFDYEKKMVQGNFLLSLWPPTVNKFLGPAPVNGTHPYGTEFPVLGIEIPNYGGVLMYPKTAQQPFQQTKYDFNSLDWNLQQELVDTAALGYPCALDKREVLWEKRHYLQGFPHALPKVLYAAHSWDFASVEDLHGMLHEWTTLSPLQAMELLLPQYPDMEVRRMAVLWVSAMKSDQLVDFLPQLLQALKHDSYEASPMAQLLLTRSLESPRIAHHLYWLLVHSLPGENPQNSGDTTPTSMNPDVTEIVINQARYHRRYQMLLRALLATCGEKSYARFMTQTMVCKQMADAAQSVKQVKESLKQKILVESMEAVHQVLAERPTALPLGPGLEVIGVSKRTCSYFNSNTLPLKINFIGSDGALVPAIFKSGDDLQQDMLTLQLVRMMDKLWLREGMDLKIVTFDCVPTGHKKGMIELVSEAETLRKIQVEWGLTGSFKDKPIAEWLAKQNPSRLEYDQAVANFTVSCAGYSVATYILGICDRHNDNIMLKTSGHLFHIDFGKFLGDAQMFGNFKRDRTPFVLTSDMAYVINGGDRPSTKFQDFVDICCRAFNIVRRHSDLLLHMLALMATSGIPGVNLDAVNYVRKALLPGQSNPEAAASFAKMIHISLKSWFTQFNFFLHNLAQLRFSGEEGNGELLSFVPRTYTMAQDGKLKSVLVKSFQKRYDLEKYYTYILRITRENQPDPSYLFRTYKEFLEFHQKLCIHFPLTKFYSLPSGLHVGRSNIKTVAQRRLPEIQKFLRSLFSNTDEVAHSEVVYTFFHPLLRDQQDADIHVAKVKDVKATNAMPRMERECGEIKLSLQYHRGALTVMVYHARTLPLLASGQEPSAYVKVYLKPDPSKATKRKTKVVRKNCFPSFMETIEYRMPIDYIQTRVLQVTVWSHDSLQENEFLGGVEINLSAVDLREECLNWHPLVYLPRSI